MSASTRDCTKFSVFLILLVGFIDHMGIGLVYPIFAAMLFDPASNFSSGETSVAMNGLYLGILIALTPLAQFVVSPYFGALSDSRGRRPVLIRTLTLGVISYVIAILGIYYKSLALLCIYRFLQGVADSSLVVAQAALTDLSEEKEKTRYFSYLSMALGAGFTLGPFFGGYLTDSTISPWFSYMTPFCFGGILCTINLLFVLWKFPETLQQTKRMTFQAVDSLKSLVLAFGWKELRVVFLTTFIYVCGWTFFFEFIPVFLIDRYLFTASDVGMFFAYAGINFSVCSGLLVPYITKRFSTSFVLVGSLLGMGCYLPLFLLIADPAYIWLFLPLTMLFASLIYPAAMTLISDAADPDSQGEALGLFQSVNAFSLALSPFLAGSLIATYPSLVIWGGAVAMLGAGFVYLLGQQRRESGGGFASESGVRIQESGGKQM